MVKLLTRPAKQLDERKRSCQQTTAPLQQFQFQSYPVQCQTTRKQAFCSCTSAHRIPDWQICQGFPAERSRPFEAIPPPDYGDQTFTWGKCWCYQGKQGLCSPTRTKPQLQVATPAYRFWVADIMACREASRSWPAVQLTWDCILSARIKIISWPILNCLRSSSSCLHSHHLLNASNCRLQTNPVSPST